jgi:hypothetical protein
MAAATIASGRPHRKNARREAVADENFRVFRVMVPAYAETVFSAIHGMSIYCLRVFARGNFARRGSAASRDFSENMNLGEGLELESTESRIRLGGIRRKGGRSPKEREETT